MFNNGFISTLSVQLLVMVITVAQYNYAHLHRDGITGCLNRSIQTSITDTEDVVHKEFAAAIPTRPLRKLAPLWEG